MQYICFFICEEMLTNVLDSDSLNIWLCFLSPIGTRNFALLRSLSIRARVSSHRAFGPVRELTDVEHVNVYLFYFGVIH